MCSVAPDLPLSSGSQRDTSGNAVLLDHRLSELTAHMLVGAATLREGSTHRSNLPARCGHTRQAVPVSLIRAKPCTQVTLEPEP